MRLAFVAPDCGMVETIKNVVKEEYHQITIIPLLYEDYKQAGRLVDEHQNEVDAILFIGVAPYNYARKYCEQKVAWTYLNRYADAVYLALIKAQRSGYNIENISIDGCDIIMLNEIYQSIGLSLKEELAIRVDPDTMELERYNEEAYQFHMENKKKGKAEACITILHTVYLTLKEQGIPVFYATPLKNAYKEAVQYSYSFYLARKYSINNIVMVSIKIEYPNEYADIIYDDYRFFLQKTELDKVVYEFAEQVKGAVINYESSNYLLVSTRECIESCFDYYRKIPLLDEFGTKGFGVIYMGIGYGENVSDAKKSAAYALKHARNQGRSAAYVCYSKNDLQGPIFRNTQEDKEGGFATEKIKRLSQKTNISINTLEKLSLTVLRDGKEYYTSKELAMRLDITPRSMNRILEKLEEAGIVRIVGSKILGSRGRPTRIFKIIF